MSSCTPPPPPSPAEESEEDKPEEEVIVPITDYLTITDRHGVRRSIHHEGDPITGSWWERARWHVLQRWEDLMRAVVNGR